MWLVAHCRELGVRLRVLWELAKTVRVSMQYLGTKGERMHVPSGETSRPF